MTEYINILIYLCTIVPFFTCTALCDSVRGPTLLDVRDEVGVSTQAMSYTFMLAAIGGLGGCIVGKHEAHTIETINK